MSASHELHPSTPEMIHGIDFAAFLENINKKAFEQKGEINHISKCGTQKHDFGLNGQTIISIQCDEEKIIVSSGVDQKYSVVINPNYKPSWADPNDESAKLDLEYVLKSVIVEGLFPGRKNKDTKAEMYRAISDKTNQFIFSYENSQPRFCNIKITEFNFKG